MDPISGMFVTTALERALVLAEKHLLRARAVKSANIEACIEYLRAAQSAINGLENEVDEILIRAKIVAQFFWDVRTERADLYERIERYLNRDQLRPLLDQAVQGITSCHKFANDDPVGFFLRPERSVVVSEVKRLLNDLSSYLAGLSGVMTLDRVNYVGPSGINMNELLVVQEFLLFRSDFNDAQQGTELAQVVKEFQDRRLRQGFTLAADSSRLIQELTGIFKLLRRGDH